MPFDKFTVTIDVQDPRGGGTYHCEYEIEASKLTLYTGPLATISVSNPVGPDAKCIMPSQDFINQIMLNFAKAFWNVQEIK